MSAVASQDYSLLDRPEILSFLFYPRQEMPGALSEQSGQNLDVPLEDGSMLGARFHHAGKDAPTILFFHGNGEIASDYDDIGPLFTTMGINFLVVDYRGYGRSTGSPTVTNLMTDCHEALRFVEGWLAEGDYQDTLVVMGRSLGSAPALELAASYPERFAGLVIESGFAFMMPLLRLMGINPEGLGISEEDGCGNLEKIRAVTIPTLVIHAEYDHIIPYSDGAALHEASAAKERQLLMIPGANHNDIFLRGFGAYMKAIQAFVDRLS